MIARMMWMGLLGIGCLTGGEWQEAIRVSEQLQEAGRLEEAERVLLGAGAATAPGRAHLHNNLGSVCQDQRRFGEAAGYYRQAIAEWETAGEEHRMALARTVNNLATLLWETGKVTEATRLMERSANIQLAVAGKNHPNAAPLFYNLGALHLNQGRYREAEDAYRQYLELRKRGAGEAAEEAVAVVNLGAIARKQGRTQDAGQYFGMAESLWKKMGTAEEAAPMQYVNLATGLGIGERYLVAEAVARKAVETAEKRCGKWHPTTAKALGLHAVLLRKVGKKAEAKMLEKRAREIEAGDLQTRMAKAVVDVSEFRRR